MTINSTTLNDIAFILFCSVCHLNVSATEKPLEKIVGHAVPVNLPLRQYGLCLTVRAEELQ